MVGAENARQQKRATSKRERRRRATIIVENNFVFASVVWMVNNKRKTKRKNKIVCVRGEVVFEKLQTKESTTTVKESCVYM